MSNQEKAIAAVERLNQEYERAVDALRTALRAYLETGARPDPQARFDGTFAYPELRLVYDPVTYPFAERSRWFTMPWGGMQEAMLRMGAASAGRASTMTIFKVGLGVTIDWTLDSSCLESDADYALYEGTLGNFTSHVPVTCSSAPGSSWNFTPAAGNRYFLLVPVNATREGSYGLGAGGAERPASASACKPQAVAACP